MCWASIVACLTSLFSISAWQEGERDDHGYSYAGCHSLPRELMLM